MVGSALIHAGTGYGVHRLPLERLEREGWLLRPHRIEAGGRLYERGLRIRSWKHRLPDAGALFAGGVRKRQLLRDLPRFVGEARRAELGHWLALAASPRVRAVEPRHRSACSCWRTASSTNVPCIAVQRYNRQRAQRISLRQRTTTGS